MQRYSCAWKRSAEAAFRPHLHPKDCRICAAAASTQECTIHNRTAALNYTTAPGHRITSQTSLSLKPPVPSRQGLFSCVGGGPFSVFQLRRTALLEWLQQFSGEERKGGKSDVESVAVLNVSDDFDAAYQAYLRCKDAAVEEALFIRLVDCVDAQCDSPVAPSGPSPASTLGAVATFAAAAKDRQWGGIRIPQFLVVPRVGVASTLIERKATAPRVGGETNPGRAANDFETYVRRRFSDSATVIIKQLVFQEALLAVQEVLMAQKIRFFLACGTALGARRDGCFIPYDEDIDLGILYTDIAAPVMDGDDLLIPDLSFPSTSPAGLRCVQMRVYRLLQALASTRAFVVFDICGAVEKGLELRVLHLATRVRIDINLYYPPLCATFCVVHDDASDDALVGEKGAFVWAASFYEAADARKHHMFRYWHKPFATELEELPFCAKRASSCKGFLVPPERYLVENYGEDWRTPKRYSYTEGLAGEFKNIVQE